MDCSAPADEGQGQRAGLPRGSTLARREAVVLGHAQPLGSHDGGGRHARDRLPRRELSFRPWLVARRAFARRVDERQTGAQARALGRAG